MNDYLSAVRSWAATPFSSNMSLLGWGLFTGLIIVLVILWNFILRDLRGAV